MTEAKGTLHMVRAMIRQDRLMELGRRRRLPLREVDTGYLVHSQLKEALGDNAPMPFAMTHEAAGRWLTVLGYAAHTAQELRELAQAVADPVVYAGIDWERLESKPMPDSWRKGQRFCFELQACPVVRMASEGPRHGKGAEVDAYLARCFREGEGVAVDRQQVYREWLRDQFERLGGAELLNVSVEAFQRERLTRRHHLEGKTKRVERPRATFSGELVINESEAFTALLRRGVGRHRAFGFGMVLLRPPGNRRC